MCAAVQIFDRVWNLTVEDKAFSYLILGDEKALLLDTGYGIIDLPARIREITELPLLVANTHYHADHSGGNRFFDAYYMHPKDIRRLQEAYGEDTVNAIPIREGFRFDLGGRSLEVVETSGHTAGSVCLLDRKSKLLFAGDTVIPTPLYFVKGDADPEELDKTLDKLIGMQENFDYIICGHGSSVLGAKGMVQTRTYLEALKGGLKAYRKGCLDPEVTFRQGRFGPVEITTYYFDRVREYGFTIPTSTDNL